MHTTLEFLSRNGYWVVFFTVLAEQLGLPLPAVPLLVAAGALAGVNKLAFAPALLLAVAACLIADSLWFWLGRRKGMSVLKTLCRISLEPDSCVSIARDWFGRMGSAALLVAKFVPGFSTAAPPMAGVNKMPLARFLIFDALGSFGWAGSSMLAGWIFRDQLERLFETLTQMGSWMGILAAAALALYVGWKWYQRRRLIHGFLSAMISPDELWTRIQGGDELVIVDLRGAREVRESRHKLPGAAWYAMSELKQWHERIPRDREIVLYCS